MINKIKDNLKSDKNFKELLSGSSVTLILKSTGMFLSYLVVILISRRFGAEGAGIYTLLLNLLISISIICTFGLDVAVLRYVGQYSNSEDGKGKIRAILKQVLKITFPLSLLVGFMVFYFSDFIGNNIFKNDTYGDGIKIIALSIPFYTQSLVCIEFIRGLKKLKFSELLRTVVRPLIVLIVLIFFVSFNEIIESIYALFVAIIILFIASVLFLFYYFKYNEVKLLKREPVLSKKELIKTSIPMMIIMVFTTILANSASYFLEYYSVTEDVGVFNICFKIAQLIGIVLLVINTIAAPKFSELYWNNKRTELKKILNQTSILNLIGGLTIATILLVFSDKILGFFGEEFVKAKMILYILILGQTINCFLGSVSVLLVMIGHQKQLGTLIIFSTLIILFAYYLIVPEFGIIGAGIVSSVGYVFFNILCVIYTYKKINLLPFNFFIFKDAKKASITNK